MKNDNQFNPNAFNLLKERGFIHTASHEAEMKRALETSPITFYLGIDPTADNLHIGHFFALQIFRILQDHGHNGILLLGNATAMIGDPSFKNDMRKMMTQEEVNNNARGINALLHRFIDTKKATIVHNADWFKTQLFVPFMRNVGTHFNVSEMLSKDCYKNRLGKGLTFLEMGYMLMQGYDFVHLNQAHGCTLQLGGSDQWSNILAGVELGRKMALDNGNQRPLMMGFCNPLLVKADGTKMGKTESGTLWVSSSKTGAYDFYQYFVNVFDEDVQRLLTFFTSMPIDEIKTICKKDIVASKKLMAFEVTKKIHGEDAARQAELTASMLFSKQGLAPVSGTPTETIALPVGSLLVDILAMTSIIKSKREARELITDSAILVNNERITDVNFAPTMPEFFIKKGKKTFLKVVLKGEQK